MKNHDEESLSNESVIRKRKFKFKSCLDYFTEFTDNTSLHGLKYVGETNTTIIERVWWIFAFTVSCLLCGFLIFKVWIKWEESPVIVTFGDTETSIWNIPFPAITVCSSEKFLNSSFYYENKCLSNITDAELFNLQSISLLCGYHCLIKSTEKPEFPGGRPIKKRTKPEVSYTNESAVDAMKEVMFRIEDVLFPCKNIELKRCRQYFRPILTSQGGCFTYNMLDINEILREDVLNINYTSGVVPMNGWSLELGYPENSTESAYPVRGKGSGLKAAFNFRLIRKRNEEESVCSGNIKGYKIALHLPGLLPPIDEDFIWIPLNVNSMISIEPQMMTITAGLTKYDYTRRKCYFPHEKRLRFFKVYSQENCDIECVTNYTLAKCNCVAFSMPHLEKARICSTKKLKCVQIAKQELFSKVTVRDEHGGKGLDSNDDEPTVNCNCLPACTSLKYKKTASHISNLNKKNRDEWDRTSIKVYFNSPYFIISQRSELYGITDFLANCGGLMGVCLGFSILSLVEIIYFLTLRCYFRIRRSLK